MASEDGFRITVDDRDLVQKLEQLDRKVFNLKPFFEEVGEIVKTSVVRNFEVGGRYLAPGDWRGGPLKWRPLSTVTLFGQAEGTGKRRGKFIKKSDGNLTSRGRKRLAGKKTLVDQALLLGSINSQADFRGVETGSNLAYSAIHHFGGKAGRNKSVNIPARPYMVVQVEDLKQILDVAEDHILGVV